ncbi:5375_t:CDS:1, partial [Cetraspora pellucida]
CIDIMLDKVKPLADNVLAEIMLQHYSKCFNKRIATQYLSK